ncbi:hypothetical protein [Nocardia noduli]|uniref:hypothetical protein n=1 Tax=Nocardia noduli TaxID=2815722 RepID=UPI001C246C12|nr:hypothetical protein [Nocardia noduli]
MRQQSSRVGSAAVRTSTDGRADRSPDAPVREVDSRFPGIVQRAGRAGYRLVPVEGGSGWELLDSEDGARLHRCGDLDDIEAYLNS